MLIADMKKAKSDNQLRKTMRISIIEGIFSQIYGTFAMIGSSFIVKMLIILQAAPIHFSLLSSIGQISQVFQPLGVAVTHNLADRKKHCVAITAAGRFLTFFLGAGLMFTNPHTGIWFVLILLFCSAALLSIGGNIWIAWISDSVPISFRGRFFSRRNQFLLFAGLIAGYIGSFTVDLFDINRKGIRSDIYPAHGTGKPVLAGIPGKVSDRSLRICHVSFHDRLCNSIQATGKKSSGYQ